MELIIVAIPSFIAAIGGIVSAYITTKAKDEQEKSARDARAYREQRERLDKAKWKVLIATMEGVSLLLHQAKGERMNGNVEDALSGIEEAKDELNEVQVDLLAKV